MPLYKVILLSAWSLSHLFQQTLVLALILVPRQVFALGNQSGLELTRRMDT